MKKRFISAFMTLAMVFSMLPVSAFAVERTVSQTVTKEQFVVDNGTPVAGLTWEFGTDGTATFKGAITPPPPEQKPNVALGGDAKYKYLGLKIKRPSAEYTHVKITTSSGSSFVPLDNSDNGTYAEGVYRYYPVMVSKGEVENAHWVLNSYEPGAGAVTWAKGTDDPSPVRQTYTIVNGITGIAGLPSIDSTDHLKSLTKANLEDKNTPPAAPVYDTPSYQLAENTTATNLEENTVGVSVKATGLKAIKLDAAETAAKHWVGIGIEQPTSGTTVTYATGKGEYNEAGAAFKAASGNQTDSGSGKTYDTFYFDLAAEGANTSYVAAKYVKDSCETTIVYVLDFTGVKFYVEPVVISFDVKSGETAITDATIAVKDADGNPVNAEADGTFKLTPGKEYTYTVSKATYKTVTKKYTVPTENATIGVALETAADTASIEEVGFAPDIPTIQTNTGLQDGNVAPNTMWVKLDQSPADSGDNVAYIIRIEAPSNATDGSNCNFANYMGPYSADTKPYRFKIGNFSFDNESQSPPNKKALMSGTYTVKLYKVDAVNSFQDAVNLEKQYYGANVPANAGNPISTKTITLGKVTYDGNADSGDTVDMTDDAYAETFYQTGVEFTLPAAPTYADHKFLGWKVGESTELKAAEAKATITADTTITAQWEAKTITAYIDVKTPIGNKTVVNATEDADLKPVIGKTVKLEAGDGTTLYSKEPTKANGRATIEGLKSDKTYTCTVVDAAATEQAAEKALTGYDSASITINTSDADIKSTFKTVDVIKLTAKTYTVTFDIKDADTEPLAAPTGNNTIVVKDADGVEVSGSGSYTLKVPEVSSYTVTNDGTAPKDYVPAGGTISYDGNVSQTVPVKLKKVNHDYDVTFSVTPNDAKVTYNVKDAGGAGTPVTLTSGKGKATLQNYQDYTYTIEKTGYVPVTGEIAKQPNSNAAKAITANLVLENKKWDFTFTDNNANNGIANIKITVKDEKGNVVQPDQSDPKKYTLEKGILYTYTISGDDCHSQSEPIPADATTKQVAKLEPIKHEYNVKFIVAKANDGSPVADADRTITFATVDDEKNETAVTPTLTDGAYVLNDNETYKYTVQYTGSSTTTYQNVTGVISANTYNAEQRGTKPVEIKVAMVPETVAETVTEVQETSLGAVDVTGATDAEKQTLANELTMAATKTEAVEASKKTIMESAAAAVEDPTIKAVIDSGKDAAKTKLKEIVTPTTTPEGGEEEPNIFTIPYLDIQTTKYEETKDEAASDGIETITRKMKMSIEPKVKVVATYESKPDDVKLTAGEENAVVIDNTDKPLEVKKTVQIDIQIPSGFLAKAADYIYYKHAHDGTNYEYRRGQALTGKLTVTLSGLSEVEFSTTADLPVYNEDTKIGYETLTEAINAANSGAKLEIVQPLEEEATVSKAIAFTLTGDPKNQENVSIVDGNGNPIQANKDGQYVVSASEIARTITTQDDGHGEISPREATLSADKSKNKATFTFTPHSGYTLASVTLGGIDVTSKVENNQLTVTFDQIEASVVLSATFASAGGSGGGGGGGSSSKATVQSATGGKTSISPASPKKGDTVTVTLNPQAGYKASGVTVKDSNGNTIDVTKESDTKYTFVMPDGKVTITPTYVKDETPVEPSNNGFVDVQPGAYYADAVAWAVDNGITNGTSANTFSPDASCTRSHMVTFLWRAAGSPAPTSANNPFNDVKPGQYYTNAVLWAVEKGITNGTSANTFSPDATVSRGQTVTFLYRFNGSPEVSGTSSFSDVPASQYYANAVAWAVSESITNGTSANTFSPVSDCTRGQIVTFLYRDIAQ